MKRLPASGERALVHVTLNTGNKERCALVDENYAPEKLRQLKDALPKVPGFADWEIVRTEEFCAMSSTGTHHTWLMNLLSASGPGCGSDVGP